MRRAAVLILASSLPLAGAGCGPGAEETCIEVALECQPLYEPTYDNVYSRTLEPTCGAAGSQCHSSEGAQNGLIFADPDQAYDLLLGGDEPRVVPGEPGCSLLVHRIEATGALQMPPGSPLPAAERCSINQWIASGAER